MEKLSPGAKGIALLVLYLAVDQQDQRPLIIDQPEENLDPRSIYTVLVPYMREAKRRRQIILVTHNANLVVNADADQVIVAESQPTVIGALPMLPYSAGALEDRQTRASICEILEGGVEAFRARERRYDIRGQPE